MLWLEAMAARSFVSCYIHGAFKNDGKAPTATGEMGGAMSEGLYHHIVAAASAVSFQASVIKVKATKDIAGHMAGVQWNC